MVDGGIGDGQDCVTGRKNRVGRVRQQRGRNAFIAFDHKLVSRRYEQINRGDAAGEINVGGEGGIIRAVSGRAADPEVGGEIEFRVARAENAEDAVGAAAFQHVGNNGEDPDHRHIIINNYRGVGGRAELIRGVGLQRKRHCHRTFDDSIVQRQDRQHRRQTAWGNDNRIGDGGVIETVAGRATEREINGRGRIGRAKAREGELAGNRAVLGRVKIAGVNPDALIVVLNCHRGGGWIGHAVGLVVGEPQCDGLLAFNQLVVNRHDRQRHRSLPGRNGHGTSQRHVTRAGDGGAADREIDVQRIIRGLGAREKKCAVDSSFDRVGLIGRSDGDNRQRVRVVVNDRHHRLVRRNNFAAWRAGERDHDGLVGFHRAVGNWNRRQIYKGCAGGNGHGIPQRRVIGRRAGGTGHLKIHEQACIGRTVAPDAEVAGRPAFRRDGRGGGDAGRVRVVVQNRVGVDLDGIEGGVRRIEKHDLHRLRRFDDVVIEDAQGYERDPIAGRNRQRSRWEVITICRRSAANDPIIHGHRH